MTDSLLSTIIESIGSIATWVSVLAGGAILTYYVLPHISGKIHANALTFIWITVLLLAWSTILQPLYIAPLVTICQYFLSLTFYQLSPYPMLQSFLDTIYLILGAWTIKIALFPESHHSKV